VRRFQIVQTGPAHLLLRLAPAHDRDATFAAAAAALRGYLAQQGVLAATIALDEQAPQPDPVSGKLREVVRATTTARRRSRRAGVAPD